MEGREPDYRFSLANERTFLAWMRTALALVAVAVAVLFHQFGTRIEPRWLLTALSGGVAVVASLVATCGFTHWRSNQIAMRHDRALPGSPLLLGLAFAMALLSVATAALVLLQ